MKTSGYEDKREKRILWVDDSCFDVEIYSLTFLKNSFEVIHVNQADEVVPRLVEYEGQFDLVILDIRLDPGESFPPRLTQGGHRTGIVIAAHIKKEYPDIPIVAFSVVNEPDVRRHFLTFGDGYILKTNYITI